MQKIHNSMVDYKRTSAENILNGTVASDDVVSSDTMKKFVDAKVNLTDSIFTLSGDILYRHPNNEGSVLCFDMYGTAVKLFIADAKYRTKLPFASADDFDTTLVNFNKPENCYQHVDNDGYNRWYLSNDAGDAAGACGLDNSSWLRNPPIINDAELQAMWSGGSPSLSTDLSAHENCDVWMTYSQCNTTAYCVGYARSLNIAEIGSMDIPNEYELMKIFINCNFIDMLDPTIPQFQAYALGNVKGVGGSRFYFGGASYAYSSTETSAAHVRGVGRIGNCGYYNKTHVRGVVPVRELNLIKP